MAAEIGSVPPLESMYLLTNFLCSNKIEILNVAGPRESKEPGVYEWTLAMLHIFFNRTASGAGCTETAGE